MSDLLQQAKEFFAEQYPRIDGSGWMRRDQERMVIEAFLKGLKVWLRRGQKVMGECPKCEVCEGASHHWIPNTRPAVKNDYICKHCPAIGDECVVCDATGCAVCNSEGVIPITTETGKDGTNEDN